MNVLLIVLCCLLCVSNTTEEEPRHENERTMSRPVLRYILINVTNLKSFIAVVGSLVLILVGILLIFVMTCGMACYFFLIYVPLLILVVFVKILQEVGNNANVTCVKP